jgi:hypothetical protein
VTDAGVHGPKKQGADHGARTPAYNVHNRVNALWFSREMTPEKSLLQIHEAVTAQRHSPQACGAKIRFEAGKADGRT